MASQKEIDALDQELFALIAETRPDLVHPSPAKDKALAAAEKRKKEEVAVADRPGADVLTRAGEGIKIDPEAKAQFLAWRIGKGATKEERIAEGMKRIRKTDAGLAYTDDEGVEHVLNRPITRGQVVLAATGPFAPLAAPFVERAYPGTLRETAGDIAGQAGNVLEMLPGAAAEYLTRGKGRLLGQVAAGAAGDFAGSPLRRLLSGALPGEDIGAGDVALRGLANAAGGVAARGATGLVAERPRLPGSKAPPSYLERRVGSRLIGEADPGFFGSGGVSNLKEQVVPGLIEEARVPGVVLPPAALSLDVDALRGGDVLAQVAGSGEKMFKRGLENTTAVNRFYRQRADALVSSTLPAEDVGRRIHADLYDPQRGYFPNLDRARKESFAQGMADLKEKVVMAPMDMPIVNGDRIVGTRMKVADIPIASNAQARVRDDLLRQGFDIGDIPSHQSLEELQTKLSGYGTRSWGGGRPAMERGVDQMIASRMKDAVLEDIEAGLPKPVVGQFKKIRARYAEMSKPLKDADIQIFADIASKGSPEKLAFEQIPAAVLDGKVPAAQVRRLFEVLDEFPTKNSRVLRRSILEEVLARAPATGKSVEGARLESLGSEVGEELSPAALANTSLVNAMPRLEQLFGKGTQIMEDVKTASNLFRRIDLSSRGAKGSQTARLQKEGELLKPLVSALFSPLKTADQVTATVFRRRLAELLADKETRNLLVGLEKSIPQNVPARTLSTSVQRLATLIARQDEAALAEEKKDEP